MCKNLVRVLDNSLLLRIRRERQEVLQPNVNEPAGVLLNWEKQAENFPFANCISSSTSCWDVSGNYADVRHLIAIAFTIFVREC